MINYLAKENKSKTISVNELEKIHKEAHSLYDDIIEYNNNIPNLKEIEAGLEEVNEFLIFLNMDKEEKRLYLKLHSLDSGLEDIDDAVETVKKAALNIIKFILKLLDRIIKFVASFFNKGVTLTEKFFLAAIIRKRDSLESAIDEKNLNKNQPLNLKDSVISKILKRKDLFLLEVAQNNGEITPGLITDYVRSTLTLFTDNMVLFDNTCGSLVNMVKDIKDTTVTENSFIGFVSEKNRYLINALKPLKNAFNRNPVLKKLIEVGYNKSKQEGFETIVIPLPLVGIQNNKMSYVAVSIKEPELVAKMKFEDVKSVNDVFNYKKNTVELKELNINTDRIEHLKVKSASFTEIDNIVEIYKEASTKYKKKLNSDKITKKLESIKKKLTTINNKEMSSNIVTYKTMLLNSGLQLATTILENSRELYKSGYCDSIRDYILGHTI